ncbi:MAG: hypothetical protein OIF47_00050 [Marinibacterium sp.]|nr:hypothetical protein [Marinibacterium sp.]
MRRIALILLAFMLPLPAFAGWVRLDGAAVRDALSGQKVIYDSGAWQTFASAGRTLYNAGHDSWGYWTVRNGRYCSQWPPSNGWVCYAVERDGQRVRFVAESGATTTGRYAR